LGNTQLDAVMILIPPD